ncbi:MAG: glycosyltransferase [Candidatus Nanohaloarchaea archaeon]|nr:glycosyltransferase [Candidatus Nanohaloarchaea archaeon]
MFKSIHDMQQKLAVYESLAQKEEVQSRDFLILHNPSSCKILDHVDKPAVLYNHTGTRELTFLFEEFMEQSSPMDEYTLRQDREEILEQLEELYHKPEVVVSNSRFIAEKTEEYFNRSTDHVYPPIDRKRFRPVEVPTGDYFISVQRLDWAKRVDRQVKAFKDTDERLKIIGDGAKRDSVENIARKHDNIEYLGRVSDRQLIEEMNRAQAVIQTSMMEDFGLVPIESLACGTPVIAPKEGGFRETIDDDTGILYGNPPVAELRTAVHDFDPDDYDPETLRESTEEYSHARFEREMRDAVATAVDRHG